VSRSLLKHIYAEFPPKLKDHSIGDLKPDKLKSTLTKVSDERRLIMSLFGWIGSTRRWHAGAVSALLQPGGALPCSDASHFYEANPIMRVVI